MQPYNQIPEGSGARSFMDAIETKIQNNRIRLYRRTAKRAAKISPRKLIRHRSIDTALAQRFREIALVLVMQVTKYLGDDLLFLMANHINKLVYIVITRSTGKYPIVYGFSHRQSDGSPFLVLALKEGRRELNNYEIASTFFHELVHTADPGNDKLDILEYELAYREYRPRSELDSFVEIALRNRTELVPRAFEGALFGSAREVQKAELFESDVARWRVTFTPLVELVSRDCYYLFADSLHDDIEVPS